MDYQDLLEKAKEASKNAYCPYSRFNVGACVLFESGNEYIGCNVENMSYGLTLCAERNAIAGAIARGEKTKLKAIAIYSPKQKKCPPCGACLQWMIEFGIQNNTKIILEDENNDVLVMDLKEFYPNGFKLNL